MQVKSMEKINLMLNPQPSEKLKSEYESLSSIVTQQRLHSRGSHDDENQPKTLVEAGVQTQKSIDYSLSSPKNSSTIVQQTI